MKSKNEKTKSLIKFWIMLISAMVVGGILGGFGNFYGTSLSEAGTIVKDVIIKSAPYALIVIEIVIFTASLFYYKKAKKTYSSWDKEDENTYDQIDRLTGIALGITNVGHVLNMICFGVITSVIGEGKSNTSANMIFILCICILFMVSIITISFMQRKFIEFLKGMNPEKKGDVLDMNFQKKWLDSCDEMEKQKVYQAAYKAYSITPVLYASLAAVLMLGQLFLDIGITPILVLGIIWITQTIVYIKEGIKK